MVINMGFIDCLICLVIVLVLFYFGFFFYFGISLGFGFIVGGGLMLFFVIFGFCGLYKLFGISIK